MFESLLDKASVNSGMILSEFGNFGLDINTSEQHTSKLKLTENPIERGANVADHAILEPKEVVVNGKVVSYHPASYTIKKLFGYNIYDYPLPIEVKVVTAQCESVVNRMASYYQVAKSMENDVIADFLPDYQSPLFNFSTADRIQDAYNKLLSIQRSGVPVTLQTNAKQYENMVLTSVSLTQQQNTCGEFGLTFREVFIVDTQMADGLNVSVKNLGTTKPEKVVK